LDPSEVTASINIKVILLGWTAYVEVHKVVPVRLKEQENSISFSIIIN
jgi:hypothetical protein